MFSPTVRHSIWKTGVDPVKWIPASRASRRATSLMSGPNPVTMLITPGGMPASWSNCISTCAAYCCVGAGFQTTVLPISAGAVGRLPAIAVKLKGVMA